MGVVIVIREVTANSRSVRHVRHGELDKDRWKYFYFCLVGFFFRTVSSCEHHYVY